MNIKSFLSLVFFPQKSVYTINFDAEGRLLLKIVDNSDKELYDSNSFDKKKQKKIHKSFKLENHASHSQNFFLI